LTQKGYLKNVLQKFNINGDMKSVSTPLAHHFKLKTTRSIEEHEYMTHVLYVGPKAYHPSFDDDQLMKL